MSIVFEKSNAKSVFHSFIEEMIPLLVGGLLGIILISNNAPSTFLKLVGIVILFLSFGLTLRTLLETKNYLNNKEHWRVEIANGVLKWHSLAPGLLKPFEVQLSDIKQMREETLEQIEKRYGTSTSSNVALQLEYPWVSDV